jgi:hypothetical protein
LSAIRKLGSKVAEFLDQPVPHAYLVAGGGGGMRSTIILRLLAEELTERKIPYTPIEGIRGLNDKQQVHVHSEQVRDMEADIAERPEDTPILFITHCIGTVAGLQTFQKVSDSRPASLVSIAPPLPSPLGTIMTPPSLKKRSHNDTLMRVVDLPPDAIDYSVFTESKARINPQYFTDMRDAADLEEHLRVSVESGRAAVYAPQYDWNTDSPQTVSAWHDRWQRTLSADAARAAQARAVIVPHAAHGLYISPRSGEIITPEADIQFQSQNVSNLVAAGLALVQQQTH